MTIAQLNPVNTVTNRPKKKIGRINEGFFYKKMYGPFASRQKKWP